MSDTIKQYKDEESTSNTTFILRTLAFIALLFLPVIIFYARDGGRDMLYPPGDSHDLVIAQAVQYCEVHDCEFDQYTSSVADRGKGELGERIEGIRVKYKWCKTLDILSEHKEKNLYYLIVEERWTRNLHVFRVDVCLNRMQLIDAY